MVQLKDPVNDVEGRLSFGRVAGVCASDLFAAVCAEVTGNGSRLPV